MELFIPIQTKTVEEVRENWPLWIDVECLDCHKEQPLSGTDGGRCQFCGGVCN